MPLMDAGSEKMMRCSKYLSGYISKLDGSFYQENEEDFSLDDK